MATKQEIILRRYHKGESERQIARGLKISRTTVRRYLVLYQESRSRLFSKSVPDSSLSEDIVSAPRYNTDSRQRRKLTDTIACEVDRLLDMNEKKMARGQHKQMMKKVDILEYLQGQGHEIGYTTICNYVSARQNRALKQAPDLEIENARRIVDARNWVIHGYDKVDDVIFWGIVVNQLPKLQQEIQRYLQE